MKALFGLIGALAAFGTVAQAPARLSDDQIAFVYQQCLSTKAVRLSNTELDESSIYPAAYQACVSTRVAVMARASNVITSNARLKQVDADAQATFPEKTVEVREMRRQFEQRSKAPGINAQH